MSLGPIPTCPRCGHQTWEPMMIGDDGHALICGVCRQLEPGAAANRERARRENAEYDRLHADDGPEEKS